MISKDNNNIKFVLDDFRVSLNYEGELFGWVFSKIHSK